MEKSKSDVYVSTEDTVIWSVNPDLRVLRFLNTKSFLTPDLLCLYAILPYLS